MELTTLFFGLTALMITLLITPIIRNLAFRIRLTDKPNKRKVHQKPVPLVGGISISMATLLTLMISFWFSFHFAEYTFMLLGSLALCVLGVFDDKYDIRASFKFAFQLVLAHFAFQNGFFIDSLYGLFGFYDIPEYARYFLTVIIIVGVVNAFNLMDGIDGLAGGVGVIALMIYAYLSYVVNAEALFLLFIILIGALIGFLRYNFSKKQKIFMGDAGSLAIGFIVILSALHLLQKSHAVGETKMVFIGVFAVLTLPVFDALRVFKGRIKSGKSPFSADKTHLHHMMLSLGFNHKISTIVIVSLLAFLVSIGFLTSSYYNVTLGIAVVLIIFNAISQVLYLNSQLLSWRDKVKKMEIE